jgi:hypothetical protein
MKIPLLTILLLIGLCLAFACKRSEQSRTEPTSETDKWTRKGNFTDHTGNYTEERMIYGETVNTDELHNVGCRDVKCDKCLANWCFRKRELIVKTPPHTGGRWVFAAPAELDCARNNAGSCEWNGPWGDKFFITLNNPTEIRADVYTSSHSIGLRIRALARYYP